MTNIFASTSVEIGTVDPALLVGGVLGTLAYFVVGAAVLATGFLVLDLMTPGNLRHQVYVDKNPNAAILLASNHLALAIIVVTANPDQFGRLCSGTRRLRGVRTVRDRVASDRTAIDETHSFPASWLRWCRIRRCVAPRGLWVLACCPSVW